MFRRTALSVPRGLYIAVSSAVVSLLAGRSSGGTYEYNYPFDLLRGDLTRKQRDVDHSRAHPCRGSSQWSNKRMAGCAHLKKYVVAATEPTNLAPRSVG